ncbi:hypothetical protein RDWZM_008869 [Blomia tropicalis]|uniref:IFT81 calponin homology domain-containing protein n=1 Tax=Blomia tropicalis TaxID=40697 RepID=A0A9Q0M5C0_BLOTA|nr:hypothetical protein RDWZM_008869 [Blomia tropicalis]
MDEIKYVIEELNQPPFVKNLNVIGYDSLRSEQRLDLLVEVLNVIDPKLNLASIRVGNIEDITTTILDTLRIFKYKPPNTNNTNFRRDLITGDKDLLTNILQWLLSRIVALKKRAYLARFLVKVELSDEVEGDSDVLQVYQQYSRLIEEFKKLQKDIKTMEMEKDQVRNKLESIRRRVNLDSLGDSNPSTVPLFEATKRYAEVRFENEKLHRQLKQQTNRMEFMRSRIETQKNELQELRLNEQQNNGHQFTPIDMLTQLEEDVAVKQRMAKVVLPNELGEIRSIVQDIENIEEQTDSAIKENHSKVSAQVQTLSKEIAELMERKLLNKNSDQDRLIHYRQNAQSVADKREQTMKQYLTIESNLNNRQIELEQLRSQVIDGDLPVKGEALKLYIENISKRANEIGDKKEQLVKLETELRALESSLNDLKRQDKQSIKDIDEFEETIGIEGYFKMKENSLTGVIIDDNNDGVEDDENGFKNDDIEPINRHVLQLEDMLDSTKEQLAPLVREVKQLKLMYSELENDFSMKKRLYDAAAANLETELSRSEAEFGRICDDMELLNNQRFQIQTDLLLIQTEHDWYNETGSKLKTKLIDEIKKEETLKKELKEREKEIEEKEDYYRKQIEMWRDLKALLDIKAKILAEKQEEKARNEYMLSANYNHLVL